MTDLDEVMEEITQTKSTRESRPSYTRAVVGKILKDTNPEQAGNKSFARVVRLQCTKCGTTWHACYEGPFPRHRADLICNRCSK